MKLLLCSELSAFRLVKISIDSISLFLLTSEVDKGEVDKGLLGFKEKKALEFYDGYGIF